METRTPKQGAEAARDAGRKVADLVYEKQLAYGDASGIQHQIWQALLAQYRVTEQLYGLEADAATGDHYYMPVELMDHIPRLTRVFDRICRIVSNPAQDRMGEDPWHDLAGDAICGMVMPRTTQGEPQKPKVAITISTRYSDYCFEGHIREAGSKEYLTAQEVAANVGRGGVVYEREPPMESSVGPSGMAGFVSTDPEATDLGEVLRENGRGYGDDPNEVVAEEDIPAGSLAGMGPNGGMVRLPRNPIIIDPEEEALVEEYRHRREQRQESDAALSERLQERERLRAAQE